MKPIAQARSLLPRSADLAALFASVRDMKCTSVVAVSNMGKSALLRSLTDPETQARHLGEDASGFLFIYIDFNQMLEMTEQAFYELVLRCTLDALRARRQTAPEVFRAVEVAYTGLVAPASAFEVPLRFAQAMAAIGDTLPQNVVLLMDEIDGPVAGIDGRVFLNLRALKDKHWQGLTYITATNRRLDQIRPVSPRDGPGGIAAGAPDADVGEFCELFAHQTLYIAPLDDGEITAFVARFAADEDVTFSEENLAFVRTWAGGHPGLLDGTCRLLGLLTGRPVRDPSQDWLIQRRAAEILPQDINVQAECRKIWTDLTPGEHQALLLLRAGESGSGDPPPEMDSVVAKHLVVESGSERRIFARTFAEFVRRQQVTQRPGRNGIRVDPDSGEVWVDGNQIPTLTNLEYRLLLLLYGRLDKICDKYEVVEAVWGGDYIDEIDDARIEKLVSRLRQKIEPDAATPQYLLTIRGRGYKLVGG